MGVWWVASGAASEGTALPGWAGVRCAPGTPIVSASDGHIRAAVIGRCGVTREELRAAARRAARSGRWAEMTIWPGSYWVLMTDGRRRFVAGDLAELRGLFWARSTVGVVWGSQAARVAGVVGAAPDLALLTARTVTSGVHWPTRSVYAGVHQVPGGAGLLLDGRHAELVDVRDVPAARTMHEGARPVADALAAALDASIGRAETVGADLSGGLDSSTVVLTATGRTRVRAVTFAGPLASHEDTAFARRVADEAAVEHHVCDGGESTWHFTVPPPVATDGPTLAAANAGMDAAYLAPVAGEPVHLTGHGGDVVLESSTAVFVDLVQAGRRREARAAVADWARATDQAPGPLWRQVKEEARGRGRALRTAADLLTAGRQAPHVVGWSWCRLGPAQGWLTPVGRDAVADLLHAAAEQDSDVRAGEWDDWAALRYTGAVARDEEPLLDALGVRPAHPFLDNQMVRACFAVPAAERRRTGQYKPLLAAARPDLPGWLTGRRSKGSFGPLLLSGLRAHRAGLRELLERSPMVTEGFVDLAAVGAALDAAAAGDARAPLAALHHALTTSLWLDQLATPAARRTVGSAAC